MGQSQLVVMHVNPALAHQMGHAEAFHECLKRHNQPHEITSDIDVEGDVHIVSGPHYALDRWRNHPRVLLLDRAYWGDDIGNISLRWLLHRKPHYPTALSADRWQKSGARLMPLKEPDERSVLLGDFGSETSMLRDCIETHRIKAFRPHPHTPWDDCPVTTMNGALWGMFGFFTVAHGFSTSALVTAGLAGLNLVCHDPDSVAARWRRDAREQWCHDLAYLNWHEAEIADGSAWEWLNAAATDCSAGL